MFSSDQTFLVLALNGEVLSEEIDDFVDEWHESDSILELHEYLGMTEQEYSLWLTNPAYLDLILSARHRHLTVKQAVNDNYLSGRIAARTEAPEQIANLRRWIETQA